jgi:hypothetical protein
MGFRFRRSFKIMPGVRLNVSKSGVSTSIGTRGATVNFSERGTKTTVGIPGTGLSYSEMSPPEKPSEHPTSDSDPEGTKNLLIGIAFIAALVAIAWVISKF